MSEEYDSRKWDAFTEANELRLENDQLRAENADLMKWLETMYAAEADPHGNERFINLPLDADGVPIHIGDYLESEELGGKRFPCRGLNVEVCAGGKRWTVCSSYDSYSGTSEYVAANSCIHVKPRTLEDVLDDFAARVLNSGHQWGLDAEKIKSKYAAEIRELLVVVE